jgi:hypothetical protein
MEVVTLGFQGGKYAGGTAQLRKGVILSREAV